MPCIDDGAKSLSMALDMLRKAEDCGTAEVVLTPHHLNGAFNNPASRIQEAFDQFDNEVKTVGIRIKLHLSSEVHMAPEAADQLLSGRALTYCNLGKAALIEPPKRNLPIGYQSLLAKLLGVGITPIIAHPERNKFLRENPAEVDYLLDLGCKVQITAQSLTGDFGVAIAKASFDMLYKNQVHLIASDAHRVEGRSPDLSTAAELIAKRCGEEVAELLFYANPKKLINGVDLASMQSKNNDAGLSYRDQSGANQENLGLNRWFKRFF